jgi:uncharacterized protein with HEPN domain
MNRDPIIFLEDIKKAIERIERSVQGRSYQEFVSDEDKLYAAFMNLAIIGEATRSIPDEVKSLAETVPWKKITGVRNKLMHEYWGHDTETVWRTIIVSLPELKVEIEKLLQRQQE